MKRNIILMSMSLLLGILFTFFILNKENIYAKEEYNIYAFIYNTYDNIDNIPNIDIPSIVVKDNNLYNVYIGLYKDINIVNKMIKYLENNKIDYYINNIKVNKKFYNILDNYEKIIINTNDDNILDKINNSILNTYLESSVNNEDN